MTSDFVQILYQNYATSREQRAMSKYTKKSSPPIAHNSSPNQKKVLFLQHERQEIHSASKRHHRHDFLGAVIYLVDAGLRISESYHYYFLPSYHIMCFLGKSSIDSTTF